MKSLGTVTLHDACHSFSSRAFKITEELELELHTITWPLLTSYVSENLKHSIC